VTRSKGEPASILPERIRAERDAAEAARPKKKRGRKGRRKQAAASVEPAQAVLPGMDN